MSTEEQMIKLKNAEGRVSEADEEICEDQNANFQCVFMLKESITSTSVRWDEAEAIGNTELLRKTKVDLWMILIQMFDGCK